MIFTGTLVNMGTVLVGGTLGCIAGRAIPEKTGALIGQGLGLCTLFIGIKGAMVDAQILTVILAVALGAIVGEGLRLEQRLCALGDLLQKKLDGRGGKISEGFVTASLLFCVGAMSIVGSIQSGLGDHSTIYTKALLDGVMATVFAARLGVGVLFSAGVIFIYQGAFEACAGLIEPYMTTALTNEIACVGNILIMGIGINLVLGTKIRVMNLTPAVFLIVPIYLISTLI